MSLPDEQGECKTPNYFYWGELDKITDYYRQKIIEETNFVLNSTYDIGNCVFWIQTGLSPARCFEPALKLMNKTDGTNISFNVREWDMFIYHLRHLTTQYFEDDSYDDKEDVVLEIDSDEKITLHASLYLSTKMLKVTSNARSPSVSFYLSASIVKDIIKLSGVIIKHRLAMLKGLNFLTFYDNFLDITNKTLIQSNYELYPDNVMTAFCDVLADSLEANAMRECLYVCKAKMLSDLEEPRL